MMSYDAMVSVIIPTYNRAHILHLTLPTYLQKEVVELIVVDDASVDNTRDVISNLQKKYPKIQYIRNEVNSKQTYSKNVGIKMAKGKYIFFGDDDSVINEGCISILLQTMIDYDSDVVGARAVYADPSFEVKYLNSYLRYLSLWKRAYATTPSDIVNVSIMSSRFDKICSVPIVVPFCHACALVKKLLAEQTLFDVNYLGCAYREETDFFIRISLAGNKIMYNSQAVSINLPSEIVRGGGAHSGTTSEWYISAKENNWYFLQKNWQGIKEMYDVKTSKEDVQKLFEDSLRNSEICEIRKDYLFPLKKALKRCLLILLNYFVK